MGRLRSMVRGLSPALLVLAALCFLLPFVGVSCNTSAAQGPLGSAFSQFGASGSDASQAQSCLSALTNKDLITYTGTDLAFGGKPSTATNIPGCGAGSPSTENPADQAALGIQPLVLIALILIVVGVVATALRAPLRWLVSGGAAIAALVLLLVESTTVHTTVIDKLVSAGSSNGANAGAFGAASADAFFNVHVALGLWLAFAALALALLVNALALISLRAAAPAGAPAPAAWGDPALPAPAAPPPGAPPPEPPPSA